MMTTRPIAMATTTAEHITLLDLQRMVRYTVEERFGDPLWVSADISELKLNRSGHCYLNLVEKGESDGAPRAEARAVIWRTAFSRLATAFAAATGGELKAGLRVLVRVVVTYHEVYGFSLQIVDLDSSYTLGEVERRRRETIARLQADGVWDMNRELDMATPALRIAVVSSPTAAGYQDFMRELGRAPYRFRATLFESLMQGDSAEQAVVEALMAIAEREEEFDAVAIIRGGGSTSDLALFDSYLIATYVAQFPLPVVTGIGHDKDISVADMVAWQSCKTPTAVATLFVGMADEQLCRVEECARALRDGVVGRIAAERVTLERATAELTRSAVVMLNNATNRLTMAEEQLSGGVRELLRGEHRRLDHAEEVVGGYSVERILRLGFAVVRTARGVVGSVDDVAVGEEIIVGVADGELRGEVTKMMKR